MSEHEETSEQEEIRKRFREMIQERSDISEEELVDSENPEKFLAVPNPDEEGRSSSILAAEQKKDKKLGDE